MMYVILVDMKVQVPDCARDRVASCPYYHSIEPEQVYGCSSRGALASGCSHVLLQDLKQFDGAAFLDAFAHEVAAPRTAFFAALNFLCASMRQARL